MSRVAVALLTTVQLELWVIFPRLVYFGFVGPEILNHRSTLTPPSQCRCVGASNHGVGGDRRRRRRGAGDAYILEIFSSGLIGSAGKRVGIIDIAGMRCMMMVRVWVVVVMMMMMMPIDQSLSLIMLHLKLLLVQLRVVHHLSMPLSLRIDRMLIVVLVLRGSFFFILVTPPPPGLRYVPALSFSSAAAASPAVMAELSPSPLRVGWVGEGGSAVAGA